MFNIDLFYIPDNESVLSAAGSPTQSLPDSQRSIGRGLFWHIFSQEEKDKKGGNGAVPTSEEVSSVFFTSCFS